MPKPRNHRRWELVACAVVGHATFAPDDPPLKDRLSATTAQGDAWRCLRCGDFALGAPKQQGHPDEAPLILRGKALQQVTIVRVLAVERLLRGILLALAAWGVWKFRGAQLSLQALFDRDLPLLRASGFRVDQMSLVHQAERALNAAPSTLALIVAGLAAYAVLEFVEAVGLWLLKRWGEYFAVIATSVFLPLEIYDLSHGITVTRVLALTINIAAVVYLLVSKRLFGLRGGRAAYDVERRGEQLLDLERAAATGQTTH